MDFPEELRYSPAHMWARLEDDGSVTVGISDFAQHELGEIAYIGLPRVGSRVTKGGELGEAESFKTASELVSPCTGEVIAINDALVEAPGLVNADPYSEGWITKIQPENTSELVALLDASEYAAVVARESH